MEKLFDYSSDDILRILSTVPIVYVLIIFYIRVLGKRSTSQLNNFDWIVTVSMGSIVASTVVLRDVSIVEGGLSVLILMILQFIVTKVMFNNKAFKGVVKSTPRLLLFEGEFIEENIKKERILKPEVYAAIRQKGFKSIKQIYAVVLETNSKISVIPNEDPGEIGFSLSDVHGLPPRLKDALKKYEDRFAANSDNHKTP